MIHKALIAAHSGGYGQNEQRSEARKNRFDGIILSGIPAKKYSKLLIYMEIFKNSLRKNFIFRLYNQWVTG